MLVYNIVNVEDYFATIKGLWDELDYLNIIPCCSCSEFPCNLNNKLIKCEEAHMLLHMMRTLVKLGVLFFYSLSYPMLHMLSE